MNKQGILTTTKKLLKIALVGAPNVGKSTLLNKLILSDVSCVSNKVHTTRKNFLAVYTEGETQLEFYDSPGIVTRQHLLKHRLEDSLAIDPGIAAQRCDLIAVIVDASNPREKRKLNKGLLKMLHEHSDKKSFLIMNKTDLIKEKRELLEIGTRLSEGCLESKRILDGSKIDSMFKRKQLQDIRPNSRFVIELDKAKDTSMQDGDNDLLEVGYKNFSQIYSISAKTEDGVDELRETLIKMAKPVDEWPHGPDYICSLNSKEIALSIIRGKVMDYTDHHVPYVVKYNFLQCIHDEFGSLHVDLEITVPNKYMVGKLLGEHGVVIFRITNESRDKISNVLGCDVKLNITVLSKESKSNH